MVGRRQFLRSAAGTIGGVCLARYAALAATADSHIEIILDEPIGMISPNIYGHFIEHLGGVIYDGVWVGEESKVANIRGVRKSLIDDLKAIQAPVIRWPGGCFADSYDWKDGIGPRDARPRRTNFWVDTGQLRDKGNVPQSYDPNHFGTNEFVGFCRAAGAEPYLAANLRSLPALDFDHWVEYCNSPAGSTTYADIRAAAGAADPFEVRYWGLGNEAWGCGGQFTPADYAVEFLRFLAWIPRYGVDLQLVASGPNGGDWDWTRSFLEKVVQKGHARLNDIYGLSLHHYASRLSYGVAPGGRVPKPDALQFGDLEWYELMREGAKVESFVKGHWEIMGEFDTERHMRLVVDEWGPWYAQGSEVSPTDVFGQMITLRDAVFSARTLDSFNRNAEKVAMANTAQMINCINSLFIAHGDQYVRTPVYHVFAMYAAHQGGTAVRTELDSPMAHYMREGQDADFPALDGSASISEDKKTLTLTVANTDTKQPRETEIAIRGAEAKGCQVATLTSADIHAHNTFENPDAVKPEMRTIEASGSIVNYTIPPASVTRLDFALS